ncbi:MAG TPA: amidohydrolase family protein [Acidimicrobiia bacterium]|nr:amidohydrolase family protein [Acidimicrobiia bacterium]
MLAVALAAVPSTSAAGADNEAVAFVAVDLIPMDSDRILENQTVLVTGDRITQIGPADEVVVPEGTTIVDGEGKYLIPGLVDAHNHILDNFDSLILDVVNGVTTIRDPNASYVGTGAEILDARDEIAAGTRLGPTIFAAKSIGALPPQFSNAFENLDAVTGPWMTVDRTLFELAVDPQTGQELVAKAAAEGYDIIKVNWFLSLETFDAVMAAARANAMPVLAHVPAAVDVQHLIESGGEIQHNPNLLAYVAKDYTRRPGANYLDVFDLSEAEERLPDLVQLMVDSGASFTPTFATDEAAFTLFDSLPDWSEYFSREEYQYVPPATLREWNDPTGGELGIVLRDSGASTLEEILPPVEQRRQMMEHYQRQLVALVEAGVPVLAGSDASALGVVWGFSQHRELELFVEAGLNPHQALAAATRIPAEVMGGADEFGTVEVGKRADLVLLAANPLDEISNTRQIEGVMVRGQWLPASELQAMLDELKTRYSAETQGAVTMEPFSNEQFSGLAPAGWNVVEPGVWARGNLDEDPTVLAQLAAPGAEPETFALQVLERYSITSLPEASDSFQGAQSTWDIYLIRGQAGVIGLALTEVGDTAYLVLLAASPAEADGLAETVFFPAVGAFAPVGQ